VSICKYTKVEKFVLKRLHWLLWLSESWYNKGCIRAVPPVTMNFVVLPWVDLRVWLRQC